MSLKQRNTITNIYCPGMPIICVAQYRHKNATVGEVMNYTLHIIHLYMLIGQCGVM